jgi:hypothetical protein
MLVHFNIYINKVFLQLRYKIYCVRQKLAQNSRFCDSISIQINKKIK